MKEAYDRVKEREAGELEEEWGLMKESLVGHASDVCGKRFVIINYYYQPNCKPQLIEQNAINPKAPAGKAVPRRKR